MASIVQRSNRYNVVYLYDDEATGKRKQKWESFSTLEDAKRRKAEVEYRQELGNVVIGYASGLDNLCPNLCKRNTGFAFANIFIGNISHRSSTHILSQNLIDNRNSCDSTLYAIDIISSFLSIASSFTFKINVP